MSAPRFSFSGRPAWQQWAAMLAASLLLIVPLELVHLPAALLLGAMGGAILLAMHEGKVEVPRWPYLVAQGLIGCLVARVLGPPILKTMAQQWPVFLVGIFAVLVFSTSLGWLLARWKILPGTTAVWGSAPGAATVMILMAEAFGGDTRLVAFMQFLRVMLVAMTASLVARFWVAGPGGMAHPPSVWFPDLPLLPVLETVAVAVLGAALGTKLKLPAGALLLPMAAGIALSVSHVVSITLPPWLMAGAYVLLGWAIGLRFTREIVLYALRMLPRIVTAIMALILLCGFLAWLLHLVAGIDMLTAYLATSPGGADSVAIIAAASHVDMPFVMAMQAARFLIVLLIGPALARMVARRVSA